MPTVPIGHYGEAKDVRCKLNHGQGIFESLADLDFDLLGSDQEQPEPPYNANIEPSKQYKACQSNKVIIARKK